ncbi:MAG: B12-binding domain-containing radical SAM protein [Elusimicrobia bacterium]|nr:B12-binding domain-containing radical SAM protein [Elusimicrobiota bacterium]MBI4217531.1 B12-binding domain-containing radical SAM protein [Elusimicrobiota bacterium]
MKILLVERSVEYIEPMHAELISALARAEGHTTYLSVLAQDDLETDLKRIKPDCLVFSGVKTGEFKNYLQSSALAKKISSKILVVMGGPHTTFFPEVIENPFIDVIGVGECDDAWPELLRRLQSGGDIHSIPNIYTKENWFSRWKQASFDERRLGLAPRTTALDQLPLFDRELVYRKTHLKDFPLRSFMSSRGCPFECTYCFEPKLNLLYRGKGPIHNRYSVRRLCEELKEMKERWQTNFIKFYDDLFWVQKKVDPWLEEFAEVYPREVGLPFFCLTRCNILTEDHLKLLKPAGLHSLTMSIECGNDYIRNEVIKRHMTREQILNAFHLCDKYDVKTFANNIYGIPVLPEIMKQHGKTALDYDIESLDLNLESKVTFGECGMIYPYPGCELSDYVLNNGWFHKEDFEKLHFSYNGESPLNCFTPKEKLMQKNLAMLSTVCLLFPWMRNLTVRHLIRWPISRFYHLLFFLVKGYLVIFKIYPVHLSIRNLLVNVFRSYLIETKKRMQSYSQNQNKNGRGNSQDIKETHSARPISSMASAKSAVSRTRS